MIQHGACFMPMLEDALGGEIDPQSVCIADVDANGAARAIFAFHGWPDPNLEGMLWARPGGLTRALLAACADYVFRELDSDRITVKVLGDNTAMLTLAPRLGFVHEGTMRAAHQGREVHIFGMLRGECRWLRDRS